MTKFESINATLKEWLPKIKDQALNGEYRLNVNSDEARNALEYFGFIKNGVLMCWYSVSPKGSLAHDMYILVNTVMDVKQKIHEATLKGVYSFQTSLDICDPCVKNKLKEDGYPNYSRGTQPYEYLIDRK
jgi:hypothetical protein